MLYSNSCEYAIRALSFMAEQRQDEPTTLGSISQAQEIPQAFLAKILQELVRAGLLRSRRGPRGGFTFARPPERIALMQIVEVVDGPHELDRCAVGFMVCSDETACPLHDSFTPIRTAIKGYLSDTSIADVAAGMQAKRARVHGKLAKRGRG